MLSQSSAYSSASVSSETITAITDERSALVALDTNSQPGELTVTITNNLLFPLNEVSIKESSSDNVLDAKTNIMPGDNTQFSISKDGDYIIEAKWDYGSATLEKTFEVAPMPLPAPAPLRTMEVPNGLTDLPIVEPGDGQADEEQFIGNNGAQQQQENSAEEPIVTEPADVADGTQAVENSDNSTQVIENSSNSTQKLNISRTIVLDNVKVNIIPK